MGVAVGGDNFENPVMQLENGDIKGASPQIVNSDDAVRPLIQTVGQGSGRWLIYQAQHFQSGNAPGVLGRLPLSVVEIGGHCNHRLGYRCVEESLRIPLKLAENER